MCTALELGLPGIRVSCRWASPLAKNDFHMLITKDATNINHNHNNEHMHSTNPLAASASDATTNDDDDALGLTTKQQLLSPADALALPTEDKHPATAAAVAATTTTANDSSEHLQVASANEDEFACRNVTEGGFFADFSAIEGLTAPSCRETDVSKGTRW